MSVLTRFGVAANKAYLNPTICIYTKNMKARLTSFFILLFLAACQQGPKVIEAIDSPVTAQPDLSDPSANLLHKVVAEEVLHTSRYTYLYVTEEDQKFWIAVPRKDVETGVTYYYRGGLKKTNFKSVEHDRVFETLYLVSDVSRDPGMAGLPSGHPHTQAGQTIAGDETSSITPPPGGITIAELFKNPAQYDGKTVRIRGRCVKLNNMIMNRNWIHLQDGSTEDNTADLTVTTTDMVPLNAIVAFEGRITLNKDFGAGYKYDIIMEEARLLQ